jgi:ketosteroid isomerase-like protein
MADSIDVVRSIYADWERGEHDSADWADPDIEFVLADGPSPGTFTGLAAMARAWRDFGRGIEDLRTFADEYRQIDPERILVLTRFGARGEESGVDVETQGAILFAVRDGRVRRLVRWWSAERALADLGLQREP